MCLPPPLPWKRERETGPEEALEVQTPVLGTGSSFSQVPGSVLRAEVGLVSPAKDLWEDEKKISQNKKKEREREEGIRGGGSGERFPAFVASSQAKSSPFINSKKSCNLTHFIVHIDPSLGLFPVLVFPV